MKKKTRKISGMFLCLVMVAMVFAVAVPMNISAGSGKARTQVPFGDDFNGGNVPMEAPYERIVVHGIMPHFGKYTAVVTANMLRGAPTGDFVGPLPVVLLPTEVVFIAANGDELYAEMDLLGPYNPIDGNFPAFTLDATFTGGTGRFAGATGSYTGSGGQITMPGEDSDLVVGSFDGTFSTVGSNKW
jgi:hypothetical protein